MNITGITYEDHGDTITVVAGAGETWDTFVENTITHGAFGLENLSGIPGTVGASPIQNIGAYGVEVKNTIAWVEVFDKKTLERKQLKADECEFGYRESIFKKPEGKSYVVTKVAFTLSKTFQPNVAYKDLNLFFGDVSPNSALEVRNAVLSVRARKMPNLSECGTAGSFFKNPIISEEKSLLLKEQYPDIPVFSDGTGLFKIPIAWILDNVLHLNGFREGNVSCFKSQPLVVCAHSGATAHEVDEFAKKIESQVYDATGIVLEREVQIIS
jgi:UDP-N-acetylmuramate dehydrogenase